VLFILILLLLNPELQSYIGIRLGYCARPNLPGQAYRTVSVKFISCRSNDGLLINRPIPTLALLARRRRQLRPNIN